MFWNRWKQLFVIFSGLAVGSIHAQIFVDANQTTNPPDGTSWATAHNNLQLAIDAANVSGLEVWVKHATYVPTVRYPDPNSTDARRATFHIPGGVKVYGGFAGTETALDDRNPDLYPTILDGDLFQDDDSSDADDLPDGFPCEGNFSDNAYHVVFIHTTNEETTAKLSGFVIRNAHADGGPEDPGNNTPPDDTGAGILVLWSNAGNTAALINRVVLQYNYAKHGGAGIFIAGKSPSYLANCRIEHNSVGDCNSVPIDGFGAGLLVSGLHVGSSGSSEIQNCIFLDNHIAQGTGAAISTTADDPPPIANCTFYGNTCDDPPTGYSSQPGGAIHCPPLGSQVCIASHTIQNCIVWNNTPNQIGEAMDACNSDVEDSSWMPWDQ